MVERSIPMRRRSPPALRFNDLLDPALIVGQMPAATWRTRTTSVSSRRPVLGFLSITIGPPGARPGSQTEAARSHCQYFSIAKVLLFAKSIALSDPLPGPVADPPGRGSSAARPLRGWRALLRCPCRPQRSPSFGLVGRAPTERGCTRPLADSYSAACLRCTESSNRSRSANTTYADSLSGR